MKTFIATSDASLVYRSTSSAGRFMATTAVSDTLADQMRDCVTVFVTEDADLIGLEAELPVTTAVRPV